MPVLDGIATTEAIRKQEKSSGGAAIPIIAVTALVEEDDKSRIFAAGIDGYHGKPVRAKILDQEIARVITKISNGSNMKQFATDPKHHIVQLDLTRLLKTVDNDWSLINEITDLFFTDAPKQMERMKQAIASNDTNELLEAAHSLKGAAGAFGQSIVYDIAYELEQLGRNNSTDSAQERYEVLNKALDSMEQNLRMLLANSGEDLS